MKERETLDQPRQTNNGKRRRYALVIGGSMAGMLTARVLANHFELVTLVERDVYPTGINHRKGVPQSHHLHALLARGLEIIEELFPNIREELVAAGAQVLDAGKDIAWQTPAGWGKKFYSDLQILSFSRPFLDWHIRRRLSHVRNVEIISGYEVAGLITGPDRLNVTGVSVKRCANPLDGTTINMDEDEGMIEADLVVDASGRHSHAPEWLSALGYEPPKETVVNAFLGYATRLYEVPQNHEREWKGIFLQAAPPVRTRGGLLFPIEGHRWTLTLCGGDHDFPPSDEQEFFKFCESLNSPMVADAIRDARPVTPIRTFRNTQNRRRHYEKLSRFPGRFLLIGDSVCAFNPVYGQGMTIAAMGALEVERSIREWGPKEFDEPFGRRFQKKLAKLDELPWSLATGEDCRYRGTEGAKRTLKACFMHAYVDAVVALTTRDIEVRKLWLQVFQMLIPSSAIFTPSVLLKVIRQWIAPPNVAKRKRTPIVGAKTFATSSPDAFRQSGSHRRSEGAA